MSDTEPNAQTHDPRFLPCQPPSGSSLGILISHITALSISGIRHSWGKFMGLETDAGKLR